MVQTLSIIFSIFTLTALVIILLIIRKNAGAGASNLERELKEIRNELHGTFEKNLNFLHEHSGKSNETIRDITSRLEQVLATNKQVVGFAGQLQNLENILRNPKHRGVLGEYFLESMLSRVLPSGSYKMQYAFKNGDIVDAAIFLKDNIIPIDAKFSLEKYNQIVGERDDAARADLEREFKADLKKRIDETSKYIKRDGGTTPYAIMYVPAEGVLGGLSNVNYEELVNYAHGKKVMIASPNTLLAYLQIVLQASKLLNLQESTQDTLKRVEELGRHLINYDSYMKKLGGHLGTAVSMYNQAYKEFGKIDKDIVRLTDGERKIEPIELDKPNIE
jgi:DNA recombination protein RmuC